MVSGKSDLLRFAEAEGGSHVLVFRFDVGSLVQLESLTGGGCVSLQSLHR